MNFGPRASGSAPRARRTATMLRRREHDGRRGRRVDRRDLAPSLENFMIGIVVSWYVLSLFLIASSLSSARAVPPAATVSRDRCMIRCAMTFSEVSRYNGDTTSVQVVMLSSHPFQLSAERGKPSTRKSVVAEASMALRINANVISTGTIFPSLCIR